MRTIVFASMFIFGAVMADAQTQPPVSYTVGIWPRVATDPNGAPPLNTAIYPLAHVRCGQPREVSSGPIVNPDEGRFEDPADDALDCVVSIRTQILTLPSGTYKVALRANGEKESSPYGSWGEAFERQGPPSAPGSPRVR